MAYTVVTEKEINPPNLRWKWYVADAQGRRTDILADGLSPDRVTAAEECDRVFRAILLEREVSRGRMRR